MLSPISSALLQIRSDLLSRSDICLALSGGKDSMVLLNALVHADLPIHAVHVHHGLHQNADEWAQFCLDETHKVGVACEVKRVQVVKQARRGLEDSAREARYAALWQSVARNGVLLTAHHQRDQAETFLLRLLRGAGVKGLAGMRIVRGYSEGRYLMRPLLSVSHTAIHDYALTQHLKWVDDPSNDDTQFTRNAIRHRVLPALNPKHPDKVIKTLAQTCEYLAEASALLDMMAEEDWMRISVGERICDVSAWRSLPWMRAKQVLSWRWQTLGGKVFSQSQWQEIYDQFYLPISCDKHPHFSWHGNHLLLSAGKLWLLTDNYLIDILPVPALFSDILWGCWGIIQLSCDPSMDIQGYYWRMRQQGDYVITHAGRKTLKTWLQTQTQLPSWQKQRWPVLCDKNHQVIGWANMPYSCIVGNIGAICALLVHT